MSISVKGTRSKGDEPQGAAKFAADAAAASPSRAPFVFGMVLVSVGLYLKSIFPGWAEKAVRPDGNTKPTDALPEAASVAAAAKMPEGDRAPVPVAGDPAVPPIASTGPVAPDAPALSSRPQKSVIVESEGRTAPAIRGGAEAAAGKPANDNAALPPGNAAARDPGKAPPEPPVSDLPGDKAEDPEATAEEPEATPEEEDHDTPNRAPRVSGPVHLADVGSCAVLAIAMADLLRNAHDPDGDALQIMGLTASSGRLVRTAEGWQFEPEPGFVGEVTLTYQISDGQAEVTQTATFDSLGRRLVEGTDCDDMLLGGSCGEDFDARGGDDNIDTGDGANVVHAGDGDDHVIAGSGNDTIQGGDGDDVILAGGGNDHVRGGSGHDRIHGEAGDDILIGGAGDDQLDGGAGRDHLDGGAGNDRLVGGSGDDLLLGGAGQDLLQGGAGKDRLAGGAGADTIEGGAGDDHVIGDLDAVADRMEGGEGSDVLDYSQASDDLLIDATEGTASSAEIGDDRIAGFETILGGAGDDQIRGSADGERLDGAGGEDTLLGEAGADLLLGGDGDDWLAGGAGADTIEAGAGDDHVIADADGAADLIEGGAGDDLLDYSAATEALALAIDAGTVTSDETGLDSFAGFETIAGGGGDDHFLAGNEPVSMIGGGGDNLFEFRAPDPIPPLAPLTPGIIVFEIQDFDVGDRLRMSKYDLFEEIMDEQEDAFERIYGEEFDDDDIRLSFHHERDAELDLDRTVIRADFNRDNEFDTTIILEGRHVLTMVEIA
ncbi:cadherin-like domain-containing protein [Paracoccus zhejiangensis]|uniref:Cadherin-like domain-containing protein n=1 Tax=Paracoccus zhejiangensis TaxID=1077935 RepID=A0A2H5F547_9RHOB|nr:cadherin-like domain-containing protein [Paracoccus zhejiangensis]AUH66670.1 hypothetical protein CX676_20430 [Paracoccus zhejiangensis]